MAPDPEPVLPAADARACRDLGLHKSALSHRLIQEPGVWARVPQPVRGVDSLWAQGLSWGKGGGSPPPNPMQPKAGWCLLEGLAQRPQPSGSFLFLEHPHVVGRGPEPPHVPAHPHRLADALPAAADGRHAHPGLPAAHLREHCRPAGESPAWAPRRPSPTAAGQGCMHCAEPARVSWLGLCHAPILRIMSVSQLTCLKIPGLPKVPVV